MIDWFLNCLFNPNDYHSRGGQIPSSKWSRSSWMKQFGWTSQVQLLLSRETLLWARSIMWKSPPDFQSTQPCCKHDCLSPILFAEGFLQLPSVVQNFPPWIFHSFQQHTQCPFATENLLLIYIAIDHGAKEQTLRAFWQDLVVNSDGGDVGLWELSLTCGGASQHVGTGLAFVWVDWNF